MITTDRVIEKAKHWGHSRILLVLSAALLVFVLTIHSSDEYKKKYDVTTIITLRNINGTLKDCGLNLSKGTLNIEHSNITFKNPILGILDNINVIYSQIAGTPWYSIPNLKTTFIGETATNTNL